MVLEIHGCSLVGQAAGQESRLEPGPDSSASWPRLTSVFFLHVKLEVNYMTSKMSEYQNKS